MFKYYQAIFILIAVCFAQSSFADETSQVHPIPVQDILSNSSLKQCEAIANACLSAGFVETEGKNKAFWHDCVRPLLLGNRVVGVHVSTSDIVSCKNLKMAKMKNELKQLKATQPQ